MMPKQSFCSPTARQRGTTLIEVLIALLVLSVGLLGMAGLQMTSLKSNYSAYYRSQASLLAYDIADRMRANRSEALYGSYDFDLTNQACNHSLSPSGSIARKDRAEWLNNISCRLSPDAKGGIERNGSIFTISIEWDDSRGDIQDGSPPTGSGSESTEEEDSEEESSNRQTFTYRTQL